VLGGQPPIAPIAPPSFVLSRLERRLDKTKEGGGAKTIGGRLGWGLKEPAGMVRLGRGASAGRGPEDFGAVPDGAIEMWVGLATGSCWGRGPAGCGCRCGQAVKARPAVPQSQVACGRQLVAVRSEGLPAAGDRWFGAQGCLRQTACGGSVRRVACGRPAARRRRRVACGRPTGVDGAGLPAAAGLRADCLPAGADWLVRVRFYLGDLPLKIGDRAGLWGTAFWPDQGANLGAPNKIGHSTLEIEATA